MEDLAPAPLTPAPIKRARAASEATEVTVIRGARTPTSMRLPDSGTGSRSALDSARQWLSDRIESHDAMDVSPSPHNQASWTEPQLEVDTVVDKLVGTPALGHGTETHTLTDEQIPLLRSDRGSVQVNMRGSVLVPEWLHPGIAPAPGDTDRGEPPLSPLGQLVSEAGTPEPAWLHDAYGSFLARADRGAQGSRHASIVATAAATPTEDDEPAWLTAAAASIFARTRASVRASVYSLGGAARATLGKIGRSPAR